MYMYEKANKLVIGVLVSLSVAATTAMAGDTLKKNVDGAVIYPIKNGAYQSYRVNPEIAKTHFAYGRAPTKNEVKAWDLDVMPDGTGLPEGKGSVAQGDELYAQHCVMCHGEFGTGGKGYPVLTGGEGTLKNQLLHPEKGDEPPIRTIGSYWPYASTLFWYIQSAMPFPHPKSLTDDETYALTAYLLSINEITIDGEELDDDYVLTREKFLKIKMPNENGFYPEVNGDVGTKEMRKFLNNPENFGTGTRCMKNCEDAPVVRIKRELNDFHPTPSTVRDLPKPKKEKQVSQGQKLYEATCSACHSNEAIGAPVVGKKEVWDALIKAKGLDGLVKNAISGVNAMPPKGGNMSLTDAQIKEIVNYMANATE